MMYQTTADEIECGSKSLG